LQAAQGKLESSVADPGCLSRIRIFSIPVPGPEFFPSRIPDPNFFHPGSWIRIFPSRIPDQNFFLPRTEYCPSLIRIKEFKYFNLKNWEIWSKRVLHPGSVHPGSIHPGSVSLNYLFTAFLSFIVCKVICS
jgi:hypothetical protein